MKIIPILLIVLLSGCNFTKTYINRAADQKKGLALTSKFYQYAKEKNFNKVFSLFGTNKRIADIEDKKEKLNMLLNGISENLGEVQSSELLTNDTKIIEGSKITGLYKIVFKIKRLNRPSFFKESFTLFSEGDQLKIGDYFINPI